MFNACSDPQTNGDLLNQQSAAELEGLKGDELTQYISGIDGKSLVPQKASSISVYEILKVAALLDSSQFNYTENITITSYDGVKISANVYSPKNMGPGPFPAVVFINSWGMDEYEYQIPAATLAKNGYVALSYSCRGFGKSGGVVNFGGPIDNADLTAVLDYLEGHFPVDHNKIAACGISYGGMSSLLALSRQSRIKTVAVMSGPADFARGLFNQDVVNAFCISMLTLGGSTQTVDSSFSAMISDLQGYKNIPTFRAWAASISAASLISEINATGKPVYLSHNFSDYMFISNANMDFYTRLTVPKKMDLNQGIHASAEAGGLLGAGNYVWSNVYRWFDYHLKGIQNGIMSEPAVTMEKKFGSGRDSFEAWPSARVKNNVYYLQPRKSIFDYDGEIKSGTYYSWSIFNTSGSTSNTIQHLYPLADTIATTGIPELSQILESFVDVPVKVPVDLLLMNKSMVYKSDQFGSGLKIRGVAKLHLNVAFSTGKGVIVAYLYDVDGSGVGTLLTYGAYGAYNKTAGQTQSVDMEFFATAYDLPAGHRLAVIIDSEDPLCGQPINGYYEEKFSYSNSMQSRFEIQTAD